jgi:soluble P-type ATPase
MIEVDIPGGATLRLEHLVLDYNGTLARDGEMLHGIRIRLDELAQKLKIYVLTADTFGKAGAELDEVPCELVILPEDQQDLRKDQYVQNLGADNAVCIGNGRNDRLMIEHAALGIAVVLAEGAAADTLSAADIVCTDIVSALDLLLFPKRLIATLRI